jgi:hypothetical protein
MKQVSEQKTRYQIRGLLLPINPGTHSPIFLEVDGQYILPLFTTRDKFTEATQWGGFSFANINVIVNPQDFHDCVMTFKKKFPFHVVVDPYITEEGNTRFQLLLFDGEKNNGQP